MISQKNEPVTCSGESERRGHTHQVDWAADIAVHESHQAIHQVTRKKGRPAQVVSAE